MTWFDVVAATLFGTSCVGCRKPGRPWCQACLHDLQAAVDPHLVAEQPPTVACLPYAMTVPEAIVGFKDRNIRTLGRVLGEILAAGLATLGDAGLVVPAPSSPAAVRRRGFDHTRQLAQVAAETAGLTVAELLSSRRRKDQAGLSSDARRRNLEGSMCALRTGSEAVIVIDDVRTSGATLRECARALRAGGYAVVGNVVVASAHG